MLLNILFCIIHSWFVIGTSRFPIHVQRCTWFFSLLSPKFFPKFILFFHFISKQEDIKKRRCKYNFSFWVSTWQKKVYKTTPSDLYPVNDVLCLVHTYKFAFSLAFSRDPFDYRCIHEKGYTFYIFLASHMHMLFMHISCIHYCWWLWWVGTTMMRMNQNNILLLAIIPEISETNIVITDTSFWFILNWSILRDRVWTFLKTRPPLFSLFLRFSTIFTTQYHYFFFLFILFSFPHHHSYSLKLFLRKFIYPKEKDKMR